MSNNQMVSVPRTLDEVLAELPESYSRDDVAYGWHECLDNMPCPKPAEQHQGEPVTLPGRTTDTESCCEMLRRLGLYGDVNVWNAGKIWNACLDELAKLGPLYTRPVQGDPTAHSLAEKVREALDRQACPNAWMVIAYEAVVQNFTHADPAEVERLRKELAELRRWEATVRENSPLLAEVERLRAELVDWKERCQRNSDEAMSWMGKHDALRAQLAEAHALLRDLLPWMERINEKSNEDIPQVLRLRAALSASAEPSAPKCDICNGLGTVPDGEIVAQGGVAFENGPIQCVKDCPSCKASPPADPDCENCADTGWQPPTEPPFDGDYIRCKRGCPDKLASAPVGKQ